jgi:hypothetical protein
MEGRSHREYGNSICFDFFNQTSSIQWNTFFFFENQMKTYLMSLGIKIWKIVVDGYKIPATLPTNEDGKINYYNNARAMNVIQGGLVETEFLKLMQLESAKEIWDKLVNGYEGDEKVKLAKLQALIMKFESLRMSEDDYVASFFIRVDETVNTMKGLSENIEEVLVV